MEILTQLIDFFSFYGYIAVFGILIACGFGLPVPEDISLVAGGVIAGLGYANPHIMFLVGMAGVLFGDSMVFLVGKKYGLKALQIPFVSRILVLLLLKKFKKNFINMVYGLYSLVVLCRVFVCPSILLQVPLERLVLFDSLQPILRQH
jgi:membrane protein DedA with SNARE-associated domain